MKKILSVVLAAVMLIVGVVPVFSADTKSDVIENADSSYASQFIETTGGATIEDATIEDGKATFTVTVPEGEWVQFMQKLSITNNKETSLKATVKVGDHTADTYKNAKFFMQLTGSEDIDTDINTVKESDTVLPGTDGMTWRFYGDKTHLYIGKGANTTAVFDGGVNSIIQNGAPCLVFTRTGLGTVVPYAPYINGNKLLSDYTSYRTLSEISTNKKSVYFRLRGDTNTEGCTTYYVTLESPDIKKNVSNEKNDRYLYNFVPEHEADENVRLSEGSYLEDSFLEDGQATFKVKLSANGGYAQFRRKITDLIGGSGSVKVTIGEDADINDYYNANFFIQLTADANAKDIAPKNDSVDAPNTDAISFCLFGYNSQYLMYTTRLDGTGAKYYTNRLNSSINYTDVTDGMTFIFPEDAEKNNQVQIRCQRQDFINAGVATAYTSNQTVADINGQDGVYVRIRNNRDVDVTYTFTITSDDIKVSEESEEETKDWVTTSKGSVVDYSASSLVDGEATFKVTLPANGGYAQFNQKLTDLIGGGATVKIKIGNGTTDDYLAANVQAQLTADAAAKTDIVPVDENNTDPGTAGMTWYFLGSSYIWSGRGNSTAGGGLYASAVGAIADLGGITFKYNLEEDGKVSYKSTTAAGFSGTLPSTKTAEEVGLTNGAYFRVRNNAGSDVTYTVTIISDDIKEPEEEILLEDLIIASENSIVDRSTVSVVDGKATFKVTLPANGGYAQFNQKLTDLIGGGATVCIKIGNGTTDDYLAANVQAQLTADAEAKTDIVPVNENNTDPGTAGMTWYFLGSSYIWSGRGNSTAGGGLYASAVGAIADLGGITFKYNLEEDGKVSYKSTTAAGFTGTLPSTKTAEEVGLTDGAYFRVRNNAGRDVTYTLTIVSDDIKSVIIKEPVVEEPVVEKDRYSFSDNDSYLISSSRDVENGVVTDTFTFKLNANGSNIQLDEKIATLIDGGFAKVYLGENTSADYAKTNFNMQLTSRQNDVFIEPVNEMTQYSEATAITFIFGISSGKVLSVNRGNGFGGSHPYIPNYENTPGVDGINVYFKTNEAGTIDITRVKALAGYDFVKTSTHNVIDADLTDGAYFRLRHNGEEPQVYTVVLTYPESNEKHDLSDKPYTVTGAKVVNADNPEEVYTTGNTITKAGHYVETTTVNGGTVTKNIYLYEAGDINGDGKANILDLVLSTSFVRYSDLSYMQSLGIKAIDEFNSYNVFPKLKRELLGLDYEVVEYNGSEPVTLKVEDFGAVGDGKTDDAVAIYDAVQALRQCAPGSVLEFEAKTYRFVDNGTYAQITDNNFRPTQAVFKLYGDKGLTIRGKTEDGKTTLIEIGGKILEDGSHYCKNYYVNIDNCEDIVIKDINFDYAEYKPAFAVTNVNYKAGSQISAYLNGTQNVFIGYLVKDANGNYPDIHLEEGETYKANGNATFGVLKEEGNRYHMYFESFTLVDKATGKIEFTLQDKGYTIRDSAKLSDYIFPMPYSGNLIERAFSVYRVNNFKMEDCKVFSASRHGMSLQHNTGDIVFDNVDVVPNDSNLNFTSWGDFYHVIHSTGANYTWIDCEAKYNYDDVFNVSAATLKLNEVKSLREIEIAEAGNGFGRIVPGTTLVIIDSATGELVYRDTIKRVVIQDSDSANIRLSTPLPAGTTLDNKYVWIEESAGNSTMTNCTFDGTFRARANITFNSCNFTIKRFWIGLESVSREGPLSRNVIFNNCSLTCQRTSVLEIGSHNKGTNAKSATAYKLENIQFNGCTWKNSSGKVTSYSSFISMKGNSADQVIHK